MPEEAIDLACFMAMVAESIGRWQDTSSFLKDMAKSYPDIGLDARVLLSRAYHEPALQKRRALSIISNLLEEETDENKARELNKTFEQIQKELLDLCNDIISFTREYLLPNAAAEECILFYYKLFGDYYRYISEFTTGETREEAILEARNGYNAAKEIASTLLSPAHPMRIGLMLNMTVFMVETERKEAEGIALAREALQEAEQGLLDGFDGDFKDSEMYIKLLRDNIEQWTEDRPQQDY